LIIAHHQSSKNEQTDKSKGSIFSYIYQNYVLRQSVNFLTIILIEGLYSLTKAFVHFDGSYQTFVWNKFVTDGVPFLVISLLLLNIGFNVFCWIWELKCDRLIEKTQIIWGLIFPKTSVSVM
jgi:hypothetical protein